MSNRTWKEAHPKVISCCKCGESNRFESWAEAKTLGWVSVELSPQHNSGKTNKWFCPFCIIGLFNKVVAQTGGRVDQPASFERMRVKTMLTSRHIERHKDEK